MTVATKVVQKAQNATQAVAENDDHLEGPVARAIEEQTAKLPSDVFLWAALGSIAVSAGLQIAGQKKSSIFVGQWVSPFLLLGIYNKIVKVAGTDKATP